MSRLEELLTLQRERSLTESEVNALIRLSRPTSPSRSAEGQRKWRAVNRDRINAAIRERYAIDPEFRARRLEYSKTKCRRRKAAR